MKEIMDHAEGDAVLVKGEERHKLAGHLKSILLQKCDLEEGTENRERREQIGADGMTAHKRLRGKGFKKEIRIQNRRMCMVPETKD